MRFELARLVAVRRLDPADGGPELPPSAAVIACPRCFAEYAALEPARPSLREQHGIVAKAVARLGAACPDHPARFAVGDRAGK